MYPGSFPDDAVPLAEARELDRAEVDRPGSDPNIVSPIWLNWPGLILRTNVFRVRGDFAWGISRNEDEVEFATRFRVTPGIGEPH